VVALLTYDQKFLARLAGQSRTVRLETPSQHWERLNIPRGAPPPNGCHTTQTLLRVRFGGNGEK
jgi:hypothetical protein